MESKDMPKKLINRERPRTSSPRQATDEAKIPPSQPEADAAERGAADVPRDVLHPVDAPPPSPYASTTEERLQAVEDFAARIASIGEGEYGDWMRRANTYWWQLASALSEAPSEARRLLDHIHMMIQFRPDFRILETSRNVIETADQIRHVLGAQDVLDPHDLGVPTATTTEEPAIPKYSVRQPNPERPHIENYGQGADLGFVGKG